jgi:DNA-binding MarR family transcriptional regulator
MVNTLDQIGLFCRKFMNRKIDIPIRSSDMGLLIYISKNENVTSKDAKAFFEVSKPMIAAMVNRMDKNGYIIKKIDQKDKRKFYLELTKKAILLVDQSMELYQSFEEHLKREMGTESYVMLIDYIQQANEAMRRMNNG